MSKISRNAPCPCGSGKKYKKCCLPLQDGKGQPSIPKKQFIAAYTDLDKLSNSVVDLIEENKLDEAEAVSRRLLADYSDQIDGLNRLAQVYEARGEKRKAADYYRKAADFANSMPGFDQESVDWYLSQVSRMKSGE
jgi:tetratricopeptide (TPR) repeat protein